MNVAIRSIGLTGGIGSGKSTAARVLVECGAHLIDSDAIARWLTRPGGLAMAALAEEFGTRAIAPDGGLDRAWMRQIAFADPQAKESLEAILHPLIGAEAHRQFLAAAGRLVVHDVPLLAESKNPGEWRRRLDRVLVIDCTPERQIERVSQRAGWDEATAARVVSQQASRRERRSIADAVILNTGLSLISFESELRALWRIWCGDSGRD